MDCSLRLKNHFCSVLCFDQASVFTLQVETLAVKLNCMLLLLQLYSTEITQKHCLGHIINLKRSQQSQSYKLFIAIFRVLRRTGYDVFALKEVNIVQTNFNLGSCLQLSRRCATMHITKMVSQIDSNQIRVARNRDPYINFSLLSFESNKNVFKRVKMIVELNQKICILN